MTLVFGATGQIGSELISLLAADGVPTRAVTRDPSQAPAHPGLEWLKADLADPASLEGVFRGVKTMFLLTGNRSDMAALQIAAIRAAAEAGVEAVVKLSALGASDHSRSPIGRAHHEAEAALLSSGMRWTILRPHVFMQNLLGQAPSIVQQGRIVSASGAIEGSLALAAYQRAGGKTAIVHDTVRQVLGRPPRSFAEFVADHVQFFNAR